MFPRSWSRGSKSKSEKHPEAYRVGKYIEESNGLNMLSTFKRENFKEHKTQNKLLTFCAVDILAMYVNVLNYVITSLGPQISSASAMVCRVKPLKLWSDLLGSRRRAATKSFAPASVPQPRRKAALWLMYSRWLSKKKWRQDDRTELEHIVFKMVSTCFTPCLVSDSSKNSNIIKTKRRW